MYVCQTITFETLYIGSCASGVFPGNTGITGQVRILRGSGQAKVTGAKSRKSLFPQCKPSIAHNSGSIKDSTSMSACIKGFSAMTNGMV